MPDPYKQQVYDQLWALLEAHTPVTALVSVGKRLKQDGDGWLRRQMMTAPNDFPRIEITNGRFTTSGWTLTQTYASEQALSTTGITDAVVRRRCEYQIIVTGRDTKSTSIDPLEEAVQVGILKGGPRLGLAFVLQCEPIDAVQKEINDNGTARLQSTMTLPVLMEFTAGALIA